MNGPKCTQVSFDKLCICIHACVCMCACINIHVCACMYTHKCVCACVPSHFSCVLLFAASWTVTYQAPVSMGFSRQEYWSGLLCPPLGTHICVCVCVCLCVCVSVYIGLPRWLSGKESTCNTGDTEDVVSISGLGRFLGEGNSNPLQYSSLGNSMDRGTWWAIVHGVAKEWDTT